MPTALEAAATTSTGVDTGAAPKRREEYPTEQILVIKTTSPDHFLTEFVSHVQKPLLAAGFACRTINNLVQSWRPFTKRGYLKRTCAMFFGSVEDTNAAWPEYESLREAVGARHFASRSASPRLRRHPAASGVAEHVHTATQHTRAIAEAAAAELAPADGAFAQA
jgi:hypothetical protein